MKRWEMGVAAGLTAAALVTGCSSGEAAKTTGSRASTSAAPSAAGNPNVQGPLVRPTGTCVPNGEWGRVPSNLKAEALAAALGGVTANQISNGLSGPAHCTPGSTAEQLNLQAPATLYSIKGMGERCMAVFVPEMPQPGKVYADLGMVCAGSESGAMPFASQHPEAAAV